MTQIDPKATRHTESRYDRISPVYNLMEFLPDKLMYNRWRDALWALVERKKVLEIGIGTGLNIPFYPTGSEITGIDLSGGMLSKAENAAESFPEKQIDLKMMDAQAMAFEEDTFDCVIGTFVFCSVPNPILGLQEVLRVTKPGGRLYLLEHMRAENALLGWAMDILDGLFHWGLGFHVARKTLDNIREAGWKIETVKELSPFGIYRLIEARKEG